MGRAILFAALISGLGLLLADHLFSPPLKTAVLGPASDACAPCGAPCPSNR